MPVKTQVLRAHKLCLKRELSAYDSADFESMLTLSQKEDVTDSLVVKKAFKCGSGQNVDAASPKPCRHVL